MFQSKDNALLHSMRMAQLIAAAVILTTFVSVSEAQQSGDDALVAQFFPRPLIDESVSDFNSGGPPPFQTSNYVAADLDGTGIAQYLVAAYTNGFSAVARVIKKQGTTGSVVAEPPLPLMAGVYPFVDLVDLDGDGRPEVVITLTSAAGFDADWIFKWDGLNLNSIGPSEVGTDGNTSTILGDADFVDLNGNGILDIINPPEPINLSDAPNTDPFTVFALSGGTYVSTGITFDYYETFARATGAPVAVTRTFSSANPNTAYVMTIANGDGHGGNRVSSADVYLNGYQIVGPSAFNQQVSVLKIPISVAASNTLAVTLKSAPGSQLTIGIGPQ
jgi:hypothetical protein